MRIRSIILFAPLLSAFTAFFLNESGFCYRKMRWLNDHDIITFAVEHEIYSSMHEGIYSSVQDFFDKNKKCCVLARLSDDQRLNGAVDTALGYRQVLVELFYKQPNIEPHEGPFYDVFMGIGPCGAIGPVWGIDASEAERPRDARTWDH